MTILLFWYHSHFNEGRFLLSIKILPVLYDQYLFWQDYVIILRLCHYNFSLDELVKNDRNGLVFHSSKQLAEQLQVNLI